MDNHASQQRRLVLLHREYRIEALQVDEGVVQNESTIILGVANLPRAFLQNLQILWSHVIPPRWRRVMRSHVRDREAVAQSDSPQCRRQRTAAYGPEQFGCGLGAEFGLQPAKSFRHRKPLAGREQQFAKHFAILGELELESQGECPESAQRTEETHKDASLST